MNYHKVKCSNFEIANNKPFTLIAGPCQLESEEHAVMISTEVKKITTELGINLMYPDYKVGLENLFDQGY